MKIIRATFEIATPMFISGADQTKAELRIPSIRGALRFWWRALAYAPARGDLDEIRRREAALFGDTQQQSKVILSFDEEPKVQTGVQNKWNNNDWQFYTGFGLVESTGKNSREYLRPGGTFTLRALLPDRLSASDVDELVATFKILGLLGGIGARTRKGWGSVRATRIDAPDRPTWNGPTTLQAYRGEVRTMLQSRRAWTTLPAYSALWAETQVAIGKRANGRESAHRSLVGTYKSFLKPTDDDEFAMSKSARSVFGLPRLTKPPMENGDARRASTVFLHVHPLDASSALPVATFLPAVFLPGLGISEPFDGWEPAHELLDRFEASA